MFSSALAVVAVGQLALAAVALRGPRPGPWIALLGCALAYDSAVVAAGTVLGHGPALETLSTGRYLVHAVLTPLVVPCATMLVSGGRVVVAGAWGTAGVLAVAGTWATLPGLHLEPRHWADTVRYADAEPGGVPLAAVAAMLLLLAAGVVLWRRRRVPWLAAGAVALFVASVVAVAVPPLGNAGEALMLAGLVAALRDARSRDGSVFAQE
ncbi:hypothetical protein [Streptomyces sp. CB03238]|uniref:hypothetical protein n=1 Tax=Streptomyces sp. CB03238 TaxID=1907777 RepID=UPI000A0FAD54|nr:hypothetical protein [Streptomyces sp. CB03238]ORT56361.1 hypothetical protein BKD26_28150 [Streptomyces sp. CB03238]